MAQPHPLDIDTLLERHPGAGDLVDALARPVARMLPVAGPPTDPTTSYVGGHPFLPEGSSWPIGLDGHPMAFLVQVNFAEVPDLGPTWPSEGLLQWFCGTDDAWGLNWDDGTGTFQAGLHVRWFTAEQHAAGSVATPGSPVPRRTDRPLEDQSPLEDRTGPTAVTFVLDRDLPSISETGEADPGSSMARLDAIYDAIYDGADDGGPEPHEPAWGDKIGGWPRYTQDPTYPASALPEGSVCVLQLDGLGGSFATWADLGTGQIIGDPRDLVRGDTSSFVWDWAC